MTTEVPVAAGVVVDAGLDAGGPFYHFVSDPEPNLALAAYAHFVGPAGLAPAGSASGSSRFSDGRQIIAARADARASDSPGGLPGSTPRPTTPPTTGPPTLAPRPATHPPAADQAEPGRQPDPPHGVAGGFGNGTAGRRPDATPRPTRSPRP